MSESSDTVLAALAIVVVAFAGGAAYAQAPNAAAPAVRAVYEAALRDLPFTDQQDLLTRDEGSSRRCRRGRTRVAMAS